jgi:tetratricopeptide (TPR) repeat protein
MVFWTTTLCVLFGVVIPITSSAEESSFGCGSVFGEGFGPYDFRTVPPQTLHLVEKAHFTSGVEALTRQGSSQYFGGDIDYTLRAFPNHPRALMSMMRLAEREGRDQPRGARYTIQCYFDRAFRFAPDDPSPRLVHGIYLLRKDDPRGAIEEMEKAETMGMKDNPNLLYNLGMAYFDLKDYDTSFKYAKQAYALGYPLPWLRDQLKAKGHWND